MNANVVAFFGENHLFHNDDGDDFVTALAGVVSSVG
jgi:hypothetical protein